MRRVIIGIFSTVLVFWFWGLTASTSGTYRTDLNIYTIPDLSRPELMTPLIDPTFGTTVTRLTAPSMAPSDATYQTTGLRHEYSKYPAVNADGTKAFMLVLGGVDRGAIYILNPKTDQVLGSQALAHSGPDGGGLGEGGGDPEFSWHPTDPNLAFWRAGAKILKFHADTLTTETWCDLSGTYDYVTTKQEGRPSDDWHYWAFLGFKVPAGAQPWEWYKDTTPYLNVIDLTSCQITASVRLNEVPDHVGISPLGNYVVVEGFNSNNEPFPGRVKTWEFDRNLQSLGSLYPCAAHSDFALDTQGREVLAYDVSDDVCAYGWANPKTSGARGMGVIQLSQGASSGYLALDFGWNQSIHLSGILSRQHPGWILSSMTFAPWSQVCTDQYGCKPFFGEILLVRLDGSLNGVRRLAHHHTQMYLPITTLSSVRQDASGNWLFTIPDGTSNITLPGWAEGAVSHNGASIGNAYTLTVGSTSSEWAFYSPPSQPPQVGDSAYIDTRDYWGEPHATSDWSGNTIFFASTWGVPFVEEDFYKLEGNWWDGSNTDTTPPTVPAGLIATPASSSQINLSWTASTDNVGVTGYKIFRGSAQIATTAVTTYSDTGLNANTTYSYTVSAYDAAGNNSAQCASVLATTKPAQKFQLGDRVKTTDKVAVRVTANGKRLGAQTLGATGTVIGGPTYAKGYNWWNIDFDVPPDGWCVEGYLIKVSP